MFKRISLALLALFLLTILLSACGAKPASNAALSAGSRIITDNAGRKVEIPTAIKTVYSGSPVGTIFMYTLVPEKIIGLNWPPPESEKKYTLASFHNLPVLGGSFGKDQMMNKEVILKAKPDIILQMEEVNEISASMADSLQKQLGIPVVVANFNFLDMDKTYTFMGSVLGVEEQAGKLADYCKQTIAEVQAKTSAIPPEKQVKVYYAEGDEGLETDPKGSPHTQVLDLVKGVNVAEVAMQKGYGRTKVSLEHILNWKPEVIIVCYDLGYQVLKNPYQFITNYDKWQEVKAVQEKKVYQIPNAPYNWFDRPPSVNRIIGIKWLANLLYPDYCKYDIPKETKDFYKLFYHVELTDQDVDEILRYSR